MLARALPLLLLVAGCGRGLDAGGPPDAGAPADFAAGDAAPAPPAPDLEITCGDLGTDPQCGACGHACQVIAGAQSNPAAIVVDAVNVYWRNLGVLTDVEPPAPGIYVHGQVVTSPVANAALVVIGDEISDIQDAPSPAAFAVAGGVAYFSVTNGDGSRSLDSCAVTGCGAAPMALFSGGQFQSIAVDGSGIYWTDYSNAAIDSGPLAGGTATTLWEPPVVGAPGHGVASGAVVDDTNVYWTNSLGTIYTCPKSGCGAGPTIVATTRSYVSVIAVDADNVYWTNNNPETSPEIFSGKIYQCAKSGCGSSPILLADGINGARGLAIDSANVYWVEYFGGTLSSCAIGGCNGRPTLLAAGLASPIAIAVDDSYVYWTEEGSGLANAGVVKRLTK